MKALLKQKDRIQLFRLACCRRFTMELNTHRLKAMDEKRYVLQIGTNEIDFELKTICRDEVIPQ